MKAAIMYEAHAPVAVKEVELEEPEFGEVLLDIVGAGVCHSDYHYVTDHRTPKRLPWLLGHEGAGVLPDAERQVPDDEPTREDAARFIIDAAEGTRDPLAVLTVGPVTNLALALQMEPGLAGALGPVTIMGGIVERHMVAWPASFETNLNSDPLAAAIVLGSGMDITLVPLEVTLQVYLDRADRDRLEADGGPVSQRLVRLIEEMREPFGGFAAKYGLDPADNWVAGGQVFRLDRPRTHIRE